MKRIAGIIIVGLLFVTCNSKSYEDEEFIAIQDIANNFLQENLLTEEERVELDGEVIKWKPFVDTLNSRIYFSAALLPISQVKEDNEWMFKDEYLGTPDSAIFYGIVSSKRFEKLTYRKFDKEDLRLRNGYERFGAMAGVSRRIVLQNSKLCGSWQVSVVRHYAKPPPR